MNRTENYQLPKWEKSDRVMMEDFNDMTDKLDKGLAEEKKARENTDARVDKCGNCGVEMQTYTGNGQAGAEHPTSLTFRTQPILAIVCAPNGRHLFMPWGCTWASYASSSSETVVTVSWSGNKVSWYNVSPSGQLNEQGRQYVAFAFFDMDT